MEAEGKEGNKIFLNDEEFFSHMFDNQYDVARAISLSKSWVWSDDYVYFDKDGYITSFSHWDDEKSPIDLDRLDILIKNKKKRYVNNISRSISEALRGV